MGNQGSCVAKGAGHPESRYLEEIYSYFQQLDQESNDVQVVIPRKKFNELYDILKVVLNKDEYQVIGLGPKAPLIQILNDRSSTPSTMFVEQLRHGLWKKYHINSDVINSIEKADPKTVLILVCNRCQYTSTKTAVEQCLKDVKHEDLFKRMILIMLHIAREEKLPKLHSSSEVNCIKSNIGGVVDMGFSDESIYQCNLNEEAFNNITKFIKEQSAEASSKQIENDPKPKKKLKSNDSDTEKRHFHQRIYMISKSNSEAVKSFVEKFQSKMLAFGIEIVRRDPSEASRLDPSLILIVVCNASSRIESDIENAFDERIGAVKNRTILIMLHVVRERKEPNIATEKKIVYPIMLAKYQPLIAIIDVAFDNETSMIYKCKMNDNAFDYFKNLEVKVDCDTGN